MPRRVLSDVSPRDTIYNVTMPIPFTVLIAVAGNQPLLARTLDSLAGCELPAGYTRTIVVENGPKSGIESVARCAARQLRVEYFYSAIPNKSNALNCALSEIRTGLVFLSDDDVRLAPQTLTSYADAAAQVSGKCYFGGPLETDIESGEIPQSLIQFLPRTARGMRLSYDRPTKLNRFFFLGPNWAAMAEDLIRINGFDSRFGPGAVTGSVGNETDAQRRLMDAGVRPCYVPQALAWHWVRENCLSDDWILHRAFRHGLEWGIVRGRLLQQRPLKRWLIRGLEVFDRIKAKLKRLQGDRIAQLEAAYRLAVWEGRHAGFKIAKQWDSLQRMPFPELSPMCDERSAAPMLDRAA